MTAMSACRIELEALRERISSLIHELKVAERITDAFDDVAPVVPPRAATVVPVASAPVAPRQTRSGSGLEKVVGVLVATRHPMTPVAIIQTSHMARSQVFQALNALVRTKRVVKRGQRRGVTYELVTHPRQEMAAGTQAAPPVGPSPATGTKTPVNGRGHGDAFDVAWNGTKERNGEAPSILPPRERKP